MDPLAHNLQQFKTIGMMQKTRNVTKNGCFDEQKSASMECIPSLNDGVKVGLISKGIPQFGPILKKKMNKITIANILL